MQWSSKVHFIVDSHSHVPEPMSHIPKCCLTGNTLGYENYSLDPPCMPLTVYNSWKGEGESRKKLINYQAKFHSSEYNQQNYYQWTSEVQYPKPKGVRKKIQQFHNENSDYPSNSLKIHICLSPFNFGRN